MPNKIYRLLDAIIRSTKDSDSKIKYNNKLATNDSVCILLDKGMGDFILFAYYFLKLIDFYQAQGKKVVVFADTYNIEFVKAYASNALDFTEVLKKDTLYLTNGDCLNKYRGEFSVAIAPCWSLTPRICCLLRVLSPCKIITLGKNTFNRGYCLNDLELLSYVDTLGIKEQLFYAFLHNELLKKITGNDYGLHIQEPIVGERIIEEEYFVVNLNASNNRKLLSTIKFLDIARRLSKEYALTPVIIGNGIDVETINGYGIFNTDYLNCFDMQTTISLCKYAKFVITSDTGIYHISFTVGNYTIIPTWSCKVPLFEPYPDELDRGRILYIRKYNNNNCRQRGVCAFRKLKRRCVPCVEKMEVGYIYINLKRYIDKMNIIK